MLRGPESIPAPAKTLDDPVLVLPRGTPLRLDPALGFHFHGADLCLHARERGLAAVAVGALCFHNSKGVELPTGFEDSGRTFARKWATRLPVRTTCAVVHKRWVGWYADGPQQFSLLARTLTPACSCARANTGSVKASTMM